jgi:hypothetical protein
VRLRLPASRGPLGIDEEIEPEVTGSNLLLSGQKEDATGIWSLKRSL